MTNVLNYNQIINEHSYIVKYNLVVVEVVARKIGDFSNLYNFFGYIDLEE